MKTLCAKMTGKTKLTNHGTHHCVSSERAARELSRANTDEEMSVGDKAGLT